MLICKRPCFCGSALWIGLMLGGSLCCWAAHTTVSSQQQALYQKALDRIREKIETSDDRAIFLKPPASIEQITNQRAHAIRRELKETLKKAKTQPGQAPSLVHALSLLHDGGAGRAEQTAVRRYEQFFTELQTLSSKAVEQARLDRVGDWSEPSTRKVDPSDTSPAALMSLNEQIYTPTSQSLSHESICSVFQWSKQNLPVNSSRSSTHANRSAFETMLQSLSTMRLNLSRADEQWHPLRWIKEKIFGYRVKKTALDLFPRIFESNLKNKRETIAPEFKLLLETTERHSVTYYSEPDSSVSNSWLGRLKQRFFNQRSNDVVVKRVKLIEELNGKPSWASVVLDLKAPLYLTGGSSGVLSWEDFQGEVFKELGVSRQPQVHSHSNLAGFLKYQPEVNGLLRPEANEISLFLRHLEPLFVTKDDAGRRFVSQANRKMIMSLVYEMIHQKVAKEAKFSHEFYAEHSSAKEEREALRVGLSLAKEACQTPGKLTPQFEERLNQLPLILFGRAIESEESLVTQQQVENLQKLLLHVMSRCSVTQMHIKPSHSTLWDYFSSNPKSPVQGYDRETVQGCFRGKNNSTHCVDRPGYPITPSVPPAVQSVLKRVNTTVHPQVEAPEKEQPVIEQDDQFYDAVEQQEDDEIFYDAQ